MELLNKIEELDLATQQKLAAMEKLLSYKPNNEKFLQFHKSTSKVRLILGGRRSGKTTSGIVEVAWAALGVHPFLDYPKPPLKIRICSVDHSTAKQNILAQLYSWIPEIFITKWWAEDRILELKNGTMIDLKSYDQDVEKFESVERHICYMDEEPSMEIYESNYLRTLSKDINGKLIITCTPLHGMTWLYHKLYANDEAVPPYVENWHVSTYENPHLDVNAIDAIKKDPVVKDNIEAAIYGKFFSHSGLIYPQFDGTKHIIPPLTSIPSDMLIVLGIDPHDRNPHAVVFCGLRPDSTWVVFDEIYDHCKISDLVAKIKTKLESRFPPSLAVIDTSANSPQSIAGRSVSEDLLQTYGLYTIAAHKDITAGRLKVAEMLDPGSLGGKPELYITQNCSHTIRQFRTYMWDDYSGRRKDKLDPKERPMKKDDHLMDALRYAIMTNVVYRDPNFSKIYKPKLPEIKSRTGYY